MSNLLGQALARILFFKEIKEYDKALVEVNKSALSLLGLDADLIGKLDTAGLRDLFGSEPALLDAKLLAAGTFIMERGEILAQQERENESIGMYMKALDLFLEGQPLQDMQVDNRIDLTIDVLRSYELPPAVKRKIVYYFERKGKFDRSEDVIFEIVNDDPSFLQDGISFYERLLLKSDRELEEGGLPGMRLKTALLSCGRNRRETAYLDRSGQIIVESERGASGPGRYPRGI